MGGSNGGGSSGKVDFPDHMKVAHKDWLDDTGSDNMTFSVVDLMNTAMAGASPYNGYVPKNPDDAFFAPGNSLSDYRSPYELLKCFDIWSTDTAFTDYSDDLDTRRGTKHTAFDADYDAGVTDLLSKIDTYITAFNTQYDSYNAGIDADHATFIADLITKIGTYVTSFNTQYDSYKAGLDTDFTSLLTALDTKYDGNVTDDSAAITAAVTAESDLLDDELNDNIMPRFKAGMANINAAMSSAYVLGEARVWDSKAKAVAKFDAEARLLRLKDGLDHALARVQSDYGIADTHIREQHAIQIQRAQVELVMALQKLTDTQPIAMNRIKDTHAVQMDRARSEIETTLKKLLGSHELGLKEVGIRDDEVNRELQLESDIALRRIAALTEWRKIVTHFSAEFARLYLVASGERDDDYLEGLHKDGTWDLEMYQYGTQVMSSITGVASQSAPRKSKIGSALGGAMSGAAIGSAIPGVGTGIGAAVGFAAGFASV